MNFNDYENKYQLAYAEFAAVVRGILEKAISATSGVAPPQSIQCRAKEATHLKPKLQDRGLLESQSIESEIKDLAGARLIFYTNTDVDRFLNSRLIPDNFEIHWDETKIHHPTDENAHQRYQAIHYTVSLNPARIALPEYAKYNGMRCEIQIQTILNHAWAETAHDMIYKPIGSKGFGTKALESIERRMTRIMDEHLLPAGYEFQKVQHDFQRLMQGKELFDKGVLETLANSPNNNERHETLSTIKEYVLPNFDDIEAIYPELSAALLKAFDDSRDVETRPIETPFGNLQGKTPPDITAIIVDIVDNLRYVHVEGAFRTLTHLYLRESDGHQRENILRGIKQLAEYNLHVWQQVGPGIQMALTNEIQKLSPTERAELTPVLIVVWREFLDSELRGTAFSADAFTLSRGAMPASNEIKEIRDKAITGLFGIFDLAEPDRREVIPSLWAATRLPSQATYSSELCAIVLSDSKRIVDLLTARRAGQPYDLLEHLEHHLLFEYHRASGIAAADRFGCKDLAETLAASILAFRDAVNSDCQYVRYKTLVGFESVFLPQWEDHDFDYNKVDTYRRKRIDEYVESITVSTREEWDRLIERCAATKSNDMATFPLFGEFIVSLSKRKPEIAEFFLYRASDDLLHFLPAFLTGLHDSSAPEIYQRTIERYLQQSARLTAIARHCRMSKLDNTALIQSVLDKAIASGEDIAIIECVVAAIQNYKEPHLPPIEAFFVPAIQYLTAKNDPRWINGAWFLPEIEPFFRALSIEYTTLVLANLLAIPKIETHAERILSCIAKVHDAAVWKFFGRRLTHEREPHGEEAYEAVPYRLHDLHKPLSNNAEAAVTIVRGWYSPDDLLFEYKAGQLLSAVFPIFPPPFASILSRMAADGTDDDIGFILTILRKYQGQPATHEVVKHLVARLPPDDPRLTKVEICLQITGVVSGEFGFSEAYRRKKGEIAAWLDDDRPRVREFADSYMKKLDRMIAAEQRRAEQGRELRRREFGSDNI